MEFIKIDTKSIAPYNMNFVTVQISEKSSVFDVKEKILKKLKPKLADPKFYDLAIVVERGSDELVESIPLYPDERPLDRLKRYSDRCVHFSLNSIDIGRKVKIFTDCVFANTNYKTVEINRETTCYEAMYLALRSQKHLNVNHFLLVRVDDFDLREVELNNSQTLIDHLSPMSSIHLRINYHRWHEECDSSSQNTCSSGSTRISSEFSDELMKEIIFRFGSEQFTWISESVDV